MVHVPYQVPEHLGILQEGRGFILDRCVMMVLATRRCDRRSQSLPRAFESPCVALALEATHAKALLYVPIICSRTTCKLVCEHVSAA